MVFTLARRAKEIGIRISLGAQPGNVLGPMMRGVVLVMLGGIPGTAPLHDARILSSRMLSLIASKAPKNYRRGGSSPSAEDPLAHVAYQGRSALSGIGV